MATRNHIDRILNATMIGRNTVNTALDLLALEPDSMGRIDDTLELAIQQLTEARARIIRALEDERA